ncbi:hypothetical protein [Polaribacter sp. 20A6]|uniref:hypothetical protein n=1 Tax=Polaribacter sp. 20A6 TaxID=2687289 RepID=UPI0013FE2D14|nr:hypothetical protein [Polaribacter sp. 20A6]
MNRYKDIVTKASIENDNNIALYFYQEYYQVRQGSSAKIIFGQNQFFRELILYIDKLIEGTIYKAKEPDLSNMPWDEKDEYLRDLQRKKDEYLEGYSMYYHDMVSIGLSISIPDWEKCNDAVKLLKAINSEYVVLNDPIAIITPNKEIQVKALVLRKSKLEFLKTEAIRASRVNDINELDEDSIDLPQQDTDDSSVRAKVSKAFRFTLSKDFRKDKQILSQQDYDKLVSWVTEYYEEDFTLPKITEPIKQVNTSKGNVFQVFKDLFLELCPEKYKSKPDSFYNLIKACFYQYRNDEISNISKSKRPTNYEEVVGELPRK